MHRICQRRKQKPLKMGKRRPPKRPQGMRGFKRIKVATDLRGFLDKRSHEGMAKDGTLHDVLYGEDVTIRRHEVFDRDGGICRKTGVYVGWEAGEMDHIENEAGKRCDCLHNLQWITKPAHIAEHPEKQLKWSAKCKESAWSTGLFTTKPPDVGTGVVVLTAKAMG
jgi:hypothetical protein